MNYNIKAHPTKYKGVMFRSRLEARWAAFFDLAGWSWEYEPIDLPGWSPDFRCTFHCGHSECGGRGSTHTLLVEVKPYFSIKEFDGHPCMRYPFGIGIPADASAAFGINPDTTYWEMTHGAGGGIESVENWVSGNVGEFWNKAGAIVQYNPQRWME
jgi:hypothetical protein